MQWIVTNEEKKANKNDATRVEFVFEEEKEKIAKQYGIPVGDIEHAIGKTLGIYGKNPQRVILAGAGTRKQATLLTLRHAIGCATIACQTRGVRSFGVRVPSALLTRFGAQAVGEHLARGVMCAAYSFDIYKTKKDAAVAPVEQLIFLGVPAKQKTAFERGVHTGAIVGFWINRVRDLGNEPAIVMTPTALAQAARAVAKEFSKKVSCAVLDRAAMKKEKMGALLGVAQGSKEEPKFIVLSYRGAAKKEQPIALVGKGITFDSGGISIKPADKMDEMKFDMLGGATVIGTVGAAAALQLRVNVIGLIPATENLPGGSAYRPGDILRAANGKTIEIINTDAEGRLILADALSYAARFTPRACIDLATLTGACVIALGLERAGLFTADEKLGKAIAHAARISGDPVWRLPFGDEFAEMNKSQVADVKNIGGREGGACNAASFLAEFVSYPWAHLDIAGTAWDMKGKPWSRMGATGHGVHLLINWLRAL